MMRNLVLHLVFVLGVFGLIAVGIDASGDPNTLAPDPGAARISTDDIIAYGDSCAKHIAAIPAFDCADGVLALITVDGEVPEAYTPDMACDRPALLLPGNEKTDGQCVPYSRALVLRDDAEVQMSAFCRKKLIRSPASPLYDEIDIILHSVTTGSTCWFQAKPFNPQGDTTIGLVGTRVPPPNEVTAPPGFPSAQHFWDPPDSTAAENCGTCHDNDPFYYSPFIAQTGQLPANPFGKYANDIGEPFKAWPKPQSLTTRGNTCTGCHRIGVQHTCSEGLLQTIDNTSIPNLDAWGQRYPQSHWMPVHNLWTESQWDEVYTESVARLLACCLPNGNTAAEGCMISPIPGGASSE